MWASVYLGHIPTLQWTLPGPIQDKAHSLQNKGMVQTEVRRGLLTLFPQNHSHSFCSLHLFFPPPSLKPRMRCLFKNALTAGNFRCSACWRRGCPERAARRTKYFAFHANSSLLTDWNPCFLAGFHTPSISSRKKGRNLCLNFLPL